MVNYFGKLALPPSAYFALLLRLCTSIIFLNFKYYKGLNLTLAFTLCSLSEILQC